jgi:hypothetical protein
MTTTVNYEGASYLYLAAMSILEDRNSEKGMRAVLPCNNAALILECKPDQDNRMTAYLTIDPHSAVEFCSFLFFDLSLKYIKKPLYVLAILL